MISSRCRKITYGAGAGATPLALALMFSPMLSLKRLLTSGKKSSLGKTSSASASVKMSVMKKPSVVARQRSPKTLSPFSRTGLEEARFRRPTVPAHGARRKTGWGRPEDCAVL